MNKNMKRNHREREREKEVVRAVEREKKGKIF